MKTIITLCLVFCSFVGISHTSSAHESTSHNVYDRTNNSHITINLLDHPKSYKNYFIRSSDNKVVHKGEIKNDKSIKFDISKLNPGTYYIVINGYQEKVIIK